MPFLSSLFLRPVLAALLLLLAGCAAGRPALGNTPEASVDWALAGEAEVIFLHLKTEALLRGDTPEQAAPVLEQLLTLAPSPEAFRLLASIEWQAGNTGQARETLKKGMDRFPDDADLVLLLAKSYITEKRFDDAVLTFQDYLLKHPKEWAMHENLGALLIDADQFASALDTMEAIPQADRTPRALLLLGKAQAELGLTDNAVNNMKLAIEADPDFFQARVELAYLYERTREYAEAEAIYAELLEEGQSSRQLLSRLVELNLKLNNPEKALEAASLGERDDPEFRLDMVQQFLDQKFYSQGLRLLGPILDLEEVPDRAWFQLALFSFDGSDDPVRALDALGNIDEEAPLFEQALLFRIHLTALSRNPAEAMRLTDLGSKRFPDQARFLLLRSELLEQTGQTEAALTELKKGAARWPKNTDILFRLGVLEDKAGFQDQALQRMEDIIRQDPDHADALNYLGYSLADQGRDLKRALVLIRSALRLEPDNIYFRDSLAWVLFRLNRLESAWKEIAATVAAAPKDPTIWEHYGDIALALGKKQEPIKGYEESLKLKAENDEVRGKLEKLRSRDLQ